MGHRSETDEYPENAPLALLPTSTRNALNALVPAEGRAAFIRRRFRMSKSRRPSVPLPGWAKTV